MYTTTSKSPHALEWLAGIFKQNGPEKHEYYALNRVLQYIGDEIKSGKLKNDVLEQKFLNAKFIKDQASIMGHSRLKPFGYAGDFFIIDRIYTQDKSEEHKKWDDFALSNDAAVAVRNRKDYFKNHVNKRLVKGGQLLNVASGPARDLMELYAEGEHDNLFSTCVEMDARAIAHAKELNADFQDQIKFVNKNIFRYQPQRKFDLIWSAGLFDYFDNRAFVLLLKRFKNWLNPGGEIVIGNFNEDHNPSRTFMELFGDWHLIHRTEEGLKELAEKAGFIRDEVSIGKEQNGVNLFLHIQV